MEMIILYTKMVGTRKRKGPDF